MWQRLRLRPAAFSTFANGAAWFFIVVSLAHLAWVIATKWQEPAGLTTLYQTDVGGEVYRAWGMAYGGVGGLLLALFQAAAVITAATFSVLPWQRGRRIGHGTLVVWSGFWALNLFRLAMLDRQIDSILQTAVLLVLFVCTLHRALGGWTPRPPLSLRPPAPHDWTAEPVEEPPPPLPGPDSIANSDSQPRVKRVLAAFAQARSGAARPLARAGRATRRGAAVALDAAGDFAHRQARRLSGTPS